MKKLLVLTLVVVMIAGFAACGAPTTEVSEKAAGQETEATVPEPTLEPSPEPTPSPTPTPTEAAPTAEEIENAKNMEEYETLKRYWENYGDVYALFFLDDLVDEGKIPSELRDEIDDEGWYKPIDNSEWLKSYFFDRLELEQYERTLNGRGEFLDEGRMLAELENVLQGIYHNTVYGRVFISVFDTQESRNRVENGIILLNQLFAEPTDTTLTKVEEMFCSGNLKPGEFLVLFEWITQNPNRLQNIIKDGVSYDIWDYLTLKIEPYDVLIMDLRNEAQAELIELNLTANNPSYGPRDWLTYEEVNAILPEEQQE